MVSLKITELGDRRHVHSSRRSEVSELDHEESHEKNQTAYRRRTSRRCELRAAIRNSDLSIRGDGRAE